MKTVSSSACVPNGRVESASNTNTSTDEQRCTCSSIEIRIIIVAIISILIGIFGCGESIAGLLLTDWITSDDVTKEWKWSNIVMIVYFTVSLFFFVASNLLLVGAATKRSILFFSYIVCSSIQTLNYIALVVSCIFALSFCEKINKLTENRLLLYSSIALYSAFVLLVAFFTWIVWRARRAFEKEQNDLDTN